MAAKYRVTSMWHLQKGDKIASIDKVRFWLTTGI